MPYDNTLQEQIGIIAIAAADGMSVIVPAPDTDETGWRYFAAFYFFPAKTQVEAALAAAALSQAAARIAEAHENAARVTVKTPTAEYIAALQNDLQQVSAAVANDQRFHAALAILDAFVSAAGG